MMKKINQKRTKQVLSSCFSSSIFIAFVSEAMRRDRITSKSKIYFWFIYIDYQSTMNFKILAVALLVVASLSKEYPLYKQCDAKWGNQQLGTSANTICKSGCLLSSVAMALAGNNKSYNPSTLNTWLKGHGGYVSGDLFVWGSVSPLGLSYVGKIGNNQIQSNLNSNNVVILNVHNGGHWVLAKSVNGGNIIVNDPGYNTASYAFSEIVAGQTGLYRVSGSFLGIMIDELEIAFNVNGRRDKMMQADRAIISQ